ncbi:MAG: hypothetical protein WBO70_01855, partial [Erysipelotrichaceae bacterium]
YTTEMNMHKIVNMRLTEVGKLENNLKNLKYNDGLLGKDTSSASGNITRLLLVRYFLLDKIYGLNLLTYSDRINLLKDECFIFNEVLKNKLNRINTEHELEERELVKRIEENNGNDVKKYFILPRIFLTKAFKYMDKNKDDKEFRFLLNLYISGYTKLRFVFVQDNVGMSFKKFKNYEYRKKEILHGEENKKIIPSVFDKYIEEGNVKQIEFRISPFNKTRELNKKIKGFNSIEKKLIEDEKDVFKYGLVLHIIKHDNDKLIKVTENYHRYEKFLNDINRQIGVLISIIERKWVNSKHILAIDTANNELYCPPEVFAHIYIKLKSEMESSLKRRMYFTYHVGEEYTNVTTGLRRIDEAIEFLKLGEGDRIGHALALGANISDYYKCTRKYINTTKQEYLDDLVWLYNIIKEFKNDNYNELYLPYLLSQIKKCKLYELYNRSKVQKYYDGMKERGKWLENKESSNCYLNDYYTNAQKYEEGTKGFCIECNDVYIAIVKIAQNVVINKIKNRNIVVEANPSSNRKISFIHNNEDLQVINLIDEFSTAFKAKNICINTDDSSIFQTNLNNEYQYIRQHYDSKGQIGENIVTELAKNSMRVSFLSCNENKSNNEE